MYRSIFGHLINNPAAYCKHHRGYLSVKQIKNKQCLGKCCRHFRKIEDHEWWTQRENIKKMKQQRKRLKKLRKDDKNES